MSEEHRGHYLTCNMGLYQAWYLVQDQLRNIYLSQPLLQRASAVRHHLNDLSGKGLVSGEFRIPGEDELLDNDGNKSIKLAVHII